jgi:DNA replication and repair protein RecF
LISLCPEKVQLVNAFNKCLKTRNKILKNYYEQRQSKEECISLLASVDKLFIDLAGQYTFAKITVIKQLNERLKTTLRGILNDPNVDIYVDYVISGQSAIDWSINQVYDALYSRLMALQTAEMASGQSLVGPQKHDVRFYFAGQDARFYCSQGQQRAIILAIKIAQIFGHYEMQNDYPVLLLDDVFSELDAAKQAHLLKILGQINTQIFLTTTELSMKDSFEGKEKTIFEIEKGQFKKPGWN